MQIVRIVQLDPATLQALADGDLARANLTSPVPLTEVFVGPDWRSTWRRRAVQVVEDPASLPWVTGVVLAGDTGDPVGRAGFHGPPDDRGMVEVGYAVDPAWQRLGYGRAVLDLLVSRAREHPAVTVLRATVSPENEPSLALVRSYPFVQDGDQWDDEDGLELVFELEV